MLGRDSEEAQEGRPGVVGGTLCTVRSVGLNPEEGSGAQSELEQGRGTSRLCHHPGPLGVSGQLGNEGLRGCRDGAVHRQGHQPQRRAVRLGSPCGPSSEGIREGVGAGNGAPTSR